MLAADVRVDVDGAAVVDADPGADSDAGACADLDAGWTAASRTAASEVPDDRQPPGNKATAADRPIANNKTKDLFMTLLLSTGYVAGYGAGSMITSLQMACSSLSGPRHATP